MKNFRRIIILFSLTTLLVLAGCGISVNQPESTPAETVSDLVEAPDFSFLDDDGGTVYLSDLQGKVVVLNFWASWCSPCRYEMPFLQRAHEEYQNGDVVILAINVAESQETVTAFLEEQNLTLPVLLDIDRDISTKYGINSYPTTLIVDRNGNISRSQGVKFGAFLGYDDLISMIENALSKDN